MNAGAPMLDTAECLQFIRFWSEITEAPHATLTSIIPDGATATRTFANGDDEQIEAWITTAQTARRNVYFTVNETHAGCNSKPSKADMVAARCRFADIDPLDDDFKLADERARLERLAEFLSHDPDGAPSAIIDSGNGIQPLWAVVREPLDDAVIARVEAETKALESALGANGTHNIDRLLRLPGTLNFPNAKKATRGRGVSRARLVFSAPNHYQPHQAAALAKHFAARLAGTDLVRTGQAKPKAATSATDDAEVTAMAKEMEAAGADKVTLLDHLPEDLQERLRKALLRKPRLADRWAGLIDDLTEAGRDSSRSGADMSVAAMVKAAGFSRLEAALILCAFPHGKANSAEWPNEGLRLRHCARCAIRSHEPKAKADGDDPVADLMAEFNGKYMVVSEAGKAIIYKPAYDPILNRRYHDRMAFADMRQLYLNRSVMVGTDDDGNPEYEQAAEVWLRHRDRRQYIGGITFDPSSRCGDADTLNLWQGFAVTPKAGKWDRLQRHIYEVICNSDQDKYDYLMNWMCRLVQHPAEQGEVAVVMQGGEGTGKGTVARALRHIFGQHGMAISNSKHLTGNFNGHLRDCVFLFADEAFYAGDPSHVGVLKSIITEPHLTIEAKYANAVQMPNFLHLMMASNEEWVVPASLDARRFLVLEVSDARANDHAYFAAIWEEMDAGGYEAMLHDLLRHDLTHFNVRRVPVTDGLQQQRKLSLGTSEAWWIDILHRGYVYRSKLGLEEFFGEWHEAMTTDVLFMSYSEYAKGRNERRPMAREAFGKFMVRMGAAPVRPRNAVIGEHIADVQTPFGTTRKAELCKQPRSTGYTIGALDQAREAFVKATGLAQTWPADAPDEAAQ